VSISNDTRERRRIRSYFELLSPKFALIELQRTGETSRATPAQAKWPVKSGARVEPTGAMPTQTRDGRTTLLRLAVLKDLTR
jgi:hypothetical protein